MPHLALKLFAEVAVGTPTAHKHQKKVSLSGVYITNPGSLPSDLNQNSTQMQNSFLVSAGNSRHMITRNVNILHSFDISHFIQARTR